MRTPNDLENIYYPDHIEQLNNLVDCLSHLTQHDLDIVIEVVPSGYGKDLFKIHGHVKRNFFYSADIRLSPSFFGINFDLLKKYVCERTSINHIVKSKRGYYFRK